MCACALDQYHLSIHPFLGMSGHTLRLVTHPRQNLFYSSRTDTDVTSKAKHPSFSLQILNVSPALDWGPVERSVDSNATSDKDMVLQ